MDGPTKDALERLERLSAVGRTAVAFAHDIRGPLHVIASTAELALSHMDPEAEVRRGLEVILRNARQASEAVQTLLRFASAGPSRGGACDLRRVAEDQLRLLDKLLASQGVRCEARLARVGSPSADERLVEAVIHHLLVNALDAMPRGGTLAVDLEAAGGEARLRIADSGPGMDADTLAKVGTPFYTTKEHGTGLGLYLVRRLLEECGGALELDSRPGRGTTATVLLPIPFVKP